jgi:hypothetical protein
MPLKLFLEFAWFKGDYYSIQKEKGHGHARCTATGPPYKLKQIITSNKRGVFYTSLDEIGLRAMSAFIHSFKVYHPYTSLKYTSAEL